MKKELPEKLRTEIGRSLELLERSTPLASELEETVERSRNLLDQSYRIIAKIKVRSFFKDDPERLIAITQICGTANKAANSGAEFDSTP